MSPVADAEVRILVALAAALRSDAGAADWALKAMARRPNLRRTVMGILQALAVTDAGQFDDAEVKAALAAGAQARRDASRLEKIAPTPSRAAMPTVIAPPVGMTRLVRDCIPTVVRSVDDVYAKVVTHVTTQGPITSEKARLDAVQRGLDLFTKAGVTGFVDRAGRKWNLTSYLEMATRTALHRASLDWYGHELLKVGIDVVRVSEHPACSPQCAPFQGKLLSLTGTTTGPMSVSKAGALVEVIASLAEARARGFNHPGCRHFLVPFSPGDDYAHPQAVDPQKYRDEQNLRARERAVRYAKSRAATAITPARHAEAQRRVRLAQKALRDHVANSSATRQRHREQLAPR